MFWVVLGCVVVVLVCLIGAFSQQQNSSRELGKGAGHAGSARYKNRGSARREKKKKIGSR